MDMNNSETCNLSTVKNTPSEARSCEHIECFYYIEYTCNYNGDDSLQYKSISDIFEMIYDLLDDVFIHMIDGGCICKMYSDGRTKRIYTIVVDAIVSEIRFVRLVKRPPATASAVAGFSKWGY